MSVEIKHINDTVELTQAADLANRIWHECFQGIITNAQIDYMVEKFQSYNAMSEQIKNQKYSYFGVYDNGNLCGYFAVKPEEDDRFFLSKLYLSKEKRGKGIARSMLSRVFEEAKMAGKNSVYLTVNKHNDHAIAVYKYVGFVVIDTPTTDIGNGFFMDDYVMEYSL